MRNASWVIRNKETGEVIFETFSKKITECIDTRKYEVVPILVHLRSLDRKVKKNEV